MVNIGDVAPDFSLESQEGLISLATYKGKKIVLYFYPKDNTAGCTNEACSFRDNKAAFDAQNTVIIGVSKDSVKVHQRFAEKHALHFPLLADSDTTLCQAYGVWGEKTMCGKTSLGIIRSTFVIDEQGKIAAVYQKVKVKGHVEAVLAAL